MDIKVTDDINVGIEDVVPEETTLNLNEADFEASETNYDDAVDGLVEGEADLDTGEFVGEEGIDDGEYFDEGAYLDSEFSDGEYMDPGFYEDEYMETGMEMGMSEMKDPLLSSWPFVIGISASAFIVSIALGAFLAKMKIKKGIDLYED